MTRPKPEPRAVAIEAEARNQDQIDAVFGSRRDHALIDDRRFTQAHAPGHEASKVGAGPKPHLPRFGQPRQPHDLAGRDATLEQQRGLGLVANPDKRRDAPGLDPHRMADDVLDERDRTRVDVLGVQRTAQRQQPPTQVLLAEIRDLHTRAIAPGPLARRAIRGAARQRGAPDDTTVVMPGFSDYENYDASGLAQLVRTSEVSASELVDAAIERIEARNPAINAVVARCFERARSQAAAADKLPDGPFRGVPFLLKDLKAHDVGQPVSNGSKLFCDHRASADDELVRRFKAAGLIICGRTNTPEFGILGVTEPELHGPTRNPWDLERTPGGSSGGAGAAVASGMVPAAHGSDGGGSIRIPASNCGLFGLKPTRDRIPLLSPDGSWGGLSTHHVLTRSVRDSAAMLDCLEGAMLGQAGLPSPSSPFAGLLEQDPPKLRIALCTDALLADDTDPVCVAAAEQAAELCESLGHVVERAKPRFDRAALTRAYLMFVACGTAATVRAYELERGRAAAVDELEPKTSLMRIIGEAVSAGEYLHELGRVRRASAEILEFFDQWDLLLTPTLAQPPLRVGEIRNTAVERIAARTFRAAPVKRVLFELLERLAKDPLAPNPNTQLFNMTGQPAMSVPLHWSDEGLPIGVQFAGRMGDEGLLLRLARQLERARPWFDRRARMD